MPTDTAWLTPQIFLTEHVARENACPWTNLRCRKARHTWRSLQTEVITHGQLAHIIVGFTNSEVSQNIKFKLQEGDKTESCEKVKEDALSTFTLLEYVAILYPHRQDKRSRG